MPQIPTLEVWLRGQLPNITPLLQPVAHALLQAQEEVNAMIANFPDELLWEKPAGVASVGFHLQHLSGVLDRLFTYAKNQSLSDGQLNLLKLEDKFPQDLSVQDLLQRFNFQIKKSIEVLQNISENELLEIRGVGRAKIPSNVLGLLFHSAEHTMRHVGQMSVTIRILKA